MFLKKKKKGPKERGGGFKRGFLIEKEMREQIAKEEKRVWGLFGFVLGRKEEKEKGWVGV